MIKKHVPIVRPVVEADVADLTSLLNGIIARGGTGLPNMSVARLGCNTPHDCARDVKLAPIVSIESPISSMSIEKVLHGDLQGSSVGQMLPSCSGNEGSAGYVAMERVAASLISPEGSSTLQYCGLMDKGAPSLTVIVMPNSATNGQAGPTGQ